MSAIAKADHECLLTWLPVTGVVLHPPKKEMKLGETVHYHSKRGTIEIYFDNRSPFGSTKKDVDGNDPPLKLKVRGDFKARCYITTPKGVKLTYKDGIDPLTSGGGNMHVS